MRYARIRRVNSFCRGGTTARTKNMPVSITAGAMLKAKRGLNVLRTRLAYHVNVALGLFANTD